MKRILFVDDEQNILDGLRNLLRRYRSEMDMEFVLGGHSALEMIRESPPDIVVSDMRMPGIDGATLLERIREEHPATVRIILSGHSEKETVFPALRVAHQILSKPCDATTLRSTLVRACHLHGLLRDASMREALGRIDSLPSLPAVYWELVSALSDKDYSVQRVAAIVENDSAMCLKLLQLVNSPCFGVAFPITSLERAVSYLGADLIRSLAFSVNIFRMMDKAPAIPGFSLEKIQAHAMLTARVVKALFDRRFANAFTAALLHDVGCTVLAFCYPDGYRETLKAKEESGRQSCEVEDEVLGLNHAVAGAYLLSLWGLPSPLIDAVAYHHDPAAAGEQQFDTPSAVAVADALVREAQHETHSSCDDSFSPELRAHLETLGVAGEIPAWRSEADREIHSWMERN